jgi:hypothetical protein
MTVGAIKDTIEHLPPDEQTSVASWISAREAHSWDEQIIFRQGDPERYGWSKSMLRSTQAAWKDSRQSSRVAELRSIAFPSFWKMYADLPVEVQRLADKQFALFRKDRMRPMNPSGGLSVKVR